MPHPHDGAVRVEISVQLGPIASGVLSARRRSARGAPRREHRVPAALVVDPDPTPPPGQTGPTGPPLSHRASSGPRQSYREHTVVPSIAQVVAAPRRERARNPNVKR